MPALAKKMSSPPCSLRNLVDDVAHLFVAARVHEEVRAFADVGTNDGGAFVSEQLDGRLADARRRAGHDRDLAR